MSMSSFRLVLFVTFQDLVNSLLRFSVIAATGCDSMADLFAIAGPEKHTTWKPCGPLRNLPAGGSEVAHAQRPFPTGPRWFSVFVCGLFENGHVRGGSDIQLYELGLRPSLV